MATSERIVSPEAQDSLVRYVNTCCEQFNRSTDFRSKMEAIDIAYARYRESVDENQDGQADVFGIQQCGVGLNDVEVPIVVSQVDSFVGYLADVFLSGYPIFPIVSTPKYRKQAEQLEAIIDNHMTLSGAPRQILLSLKDGIKYNFFGLENDWCPVSQYSVLTSYRDIESGPQAQKSFKYINKPTRRDPYNILWDETVAPGDVAFHGEWAGYIEIISRVELKRRLSYYKATPYGYNTSQAMFTMSNVNAISTSANFYKDSPQISSLVARKSPRDYGVTDWVAWLNNQRSKAGKLYQGKYESVTIYARIIPAEHKLRVPNAEEPQVWKLIVINNQRLVYAQRIISAYDLLPMFIGQPIEDGFGIQTQGIGELEIPFQDAASTLLSIRFNAARRAVSDRAIYDPNAISSADINAPVPAPKIPLRQNFLIGTKTFDQIYKSIPFEAKGTEGAVQDLSLLLGMSDQLSGTNKPRRGEFQKGNKSVREWTDTMEGSDNRLRLPALTLEFQTFMPLKESIKMNIIQYEQPGIYMNYNTGEPFDITETNLEEIRKLSLQFKVADGYTPKSKIASTDVLSAGIQTLSSSQPLAVALGPALPKMFTHLMSLGGVKGLDEYLPEETAQTQPPVTNTQNEPAA